MSGIARFTHPNPTGCLLLGPLGTSQRGVLSFERRQLVRDVGGFGRLARSGEPPLERESVTSCAQAHVALRATKGSQLLDAGAASLLHHRLIRAQPERARAELGVVEIK